MSEVVENIQEIDVMELHNLPSKYLEIYIFFWYSFVAVSYRI